MFAGSTRAPLQIHVGMGIKKACASVLGTNLVEVRLGRGAFVVQRVYVTVKGVI